MTDPKNDLQYQVKRTKMYYDNWSDKKTFLPLPPAVTDYIEALENRVKQLEEYVEYENSSRRL